ncbi:MAG: glycosyltransferase family 4 protein, partial [Minisyncoccia bacterium]
GRNIMIMNAINMDIREQQNIGIITKPISKASIVPLSNLIDILRPFSDTIYVITGGEGMRLMQKDDAGVFVLGVKYTKKDNVIIKIAYHIETQLIMSFNLIRSYKNVHIWIFFIDSHSFLLPVLTAKLLGKKIIFALAASIKNSAKAQEDILADVLVYFENINFKLSNRIVVYTSNLVKEWNLEKYESKISVAHRHIPDFDKFKTQRQLNERDNLVGYVGRLSEEKGALNFVRAIHEISKENDVIKFVIVGDGHLKGEIDKYVSSNNLMEKVELLGWVPHEELPGYLNQLKLLVLPSYSEGLPNIMLEAMACGTLVLATPVGAIPDIIIDGETGFLMECNSPECIVSNIIRALKHPDQEGISKRALALVVSEFSYENAVKQWEDVLDKV